MAATRSRGGMVRFSQEAMAELRKVTWPTRQAVVRLTIIVLIISAIVSLYIFTVDILFTEAITKGILGQDPSRTAPPDPLGP